MCQLQRSGQVLRSGRTQLGSKRSFLQRSSLKSIQAIVQFGNPVPESARMCELYCVVLQPC